MPTRSVRTSAARCPDADPHRQPFCAAAGARPTSPARAPDAVQRDRRRRSPRCAPRSPSSRATAACCVFMPPIDTLEDYRRPGRGHRRRPRAELGVPVHLEGYAPPHDPRAQRDQGHARSRRDRGQHPPGAQLGRAASRSPTALYEERASDAARHREVHARRPPHRHRRRQPRRPRRRHAGRQPVPAPARSAAQPDRAIGRTIRRCRTCSPACSSGRRARRRASTRRATTRLYELELAFEQVPDQRGAAAAVAGRPACSATCWSTSRATRTAPSSASTSCTRPTAPTGRLGLVEFRAFEMPPHPQMSLAQQLLLRALVARFWKRRRIERARALGHRAARPVHAAAFHVWQDFADVIADMNRAGYRARRRRGSRRTSSSASRCTARSSYGGVELELRQALEPWHVLGEEGATGRHGALCRLVGRALAGEGARLTATGVTSSPATAGACRSSRPGAPTSSSAACAFARGSPPSSLHPTIPIDTPLVFDLYDRWSGRAVGGLHVSRRCIPAGGASSASR